MVDIHKRTQALERLRTNIDEHEDISDANAAELEDFYFWLKKQPANNGNGTLSTAMVLRYMQTAKLVAEHVDFDLVPFTREKADVIDTQIEHSEWYHGTYAEGTKKTHRKFIRTFAKYDDGLTTKHDAPDRVEWVSTTNPDKNYTSSAELLKPSHIRKVCREIHNLRDKALLMLQWDAGGRIAETCDCRVGDFYEQDGRYYMHIHGNKRSADRDTRIHVAAPAIKRWLEEGHPAPDDEDAMLFCTTHPQPDPSAVPNYRRFRQVLQTAADEAGVEKNAQRTHLFRKSRVSYLAVYKGLPETAIDERIGHVAMSDVTRRYARIGDKEANRAYDESYGLDVDYEGEEDVEPLECPDCGDVNAGFRDRCYECDTALTSLQSNASQDQVDRAKSLLMDVLQEAGRMEELQKVVEG